MIRKKQQEFFDTRYDYIKLIDYQERVENKIFHTTCTVSLFITKIFKYVNKLWSSLCEFSSEFFESGQ